MSAGITFQEFSSYLSDASGQGATFLSEVFEQIQKGAISEANALSRSADALAQDFQRFSETATKYAEKAAQAGNSRAAEMFGRISDAHAQGSYKWGQTPFQTA